MGTLGAAGRIEYLNCFEVAVPAEMMATTALTLTHFEHSTIGPGGTLYDQWINTAMAGRRMGGAVTGLSSASIIGCPAYTDFDLVRPTAVTYRLRIDYVLDSASPPTSVTATAESVIVADLPARPIMTGVTVVHDIADTSLIPRGRPPITFVADGQGGEGAYEYKWLYSGTTLLRDWSSSSTLVWDGTVKGVPTDPSRVSSIFVHARRAGGTLTEVSNRTEIIVDHP